METEHTETVVEKAVAYVKDMLGIAPSDKTPDVEAKPEYVDTPPEVTAEDAMRLDPNAYTRKSVADLNLERAPRALQEETIENHENIERRSQRDEGRQGAASRQRVRENGQTGRTFRWRDP
jgi:hypothetical protein